MKLGRTFQSSWRKPPISNWLTFVSGFPSDKRNWLAPPPSNRICSPVSPRARNTCVRRKRSILVMTSVPPIGLSFASRIGPGPPPKNVYVPPKFCGENCVMLIERKRPPNLNEWGPCASEVVLVSSHSFSSVCDWPTWDPPPVNASCTSSVGIELSAFCALRACSNWKRVSLTMVLLIIEVSVNWTLWSVLSVSYAREGNEKPPVPTVLLFFE